MPRRETDSVALEEAETLDVEGGWGDNLQL